jgi:hypothetical protein
LTVFAFLVVFLEVGLACFLAVFFAGSGLEVAFVFLLALEVVVDLAPAETFFFLATEAVLEVVVFFFLDSPEAIVFFLLVPICVFLVVLLAEEAVFFFAFCVSDLVFVREAGFFLD